MSEAERPVARSILTAATAALGVPMADPLLQLLLDPISQEISRRRSVALRTAEQLAGCSREELADRISVNPLGVDRLVRVIYIAGMNGHDPVLRMMGRCLIRGLEAAETGDAERLVQEESILDALDTLAPRHVRMLSQIEMSPGIPNGDLAAAVVRWDSFPDLTASELLTLGLVDDPYGRYGEGTEKARFYWVSALGVLVLRAAEEVAFRDNA